MARTDDNLSEGEVPEVPPEQVPGKFHESDESAKQAADADDSDEPKPVKKTTRKK